MKKRVISILLSAAMISSMVVAGGVTAHAEENVTLNVFDAHAYGLDEYDEMVKAFEESHPGVTVDVQHAANDYDTLLQSRVNSGDTPDVFDAEAGTKAKMYYDYAYDWSNDTEVLDKFNEDAVNLGKDDEGNVKSLPWTYENMGLIYNKDCFEKAGRGMQEAEGCRHHSVCACFKGNMGIRTGCNTFHDRQRQNSC